MPKDDLVKQIDMRFSSRTGGGVGSWGISTPSAPSTPPVVSTEAIYRPDYDTIRLSRSTSLTRDISEVSDIIYLAAMIVTEDELLTATTFGGIQFVVQQIRLPEEVISLINYTGEVNGEHRYTISRGHYLTTPTRYTAYEAKIFYAQRGFEFDGSFRQPAIHLNRLYNESETSLGYLKRTSDTLKNQFPGWLDWEVYGLVTDYLRLTEAAHIKSLDVSGDATVRDKLTVTHDNAGLIAGLTPTGDGINVVDSTGYPWVKAHSVVDSAGDEHRDFKVDNADTAELGGDKVILAGASNGMILPTALAEEHYLTLSPSVVLSDGRHYSEFKIGDPVITTTRQEVIDNVDHTLVYNVLEDLVSLTAASDFPVGSKIEYAVRLSEEGGVESPFDVILYINGAEKDRRQVLINNTSTAIRGDFLTNVIIAIGDTVAVKVLFGSDTAGASGFSRASGVNNKVSIQHD